MRATIVAAAAGVLLLGVLGGVAGAHPLGLPAFAQIAATAEGEVVVVWNAAPDDVGALGRSLGADVPEGGALNRAQDAELSGSPQLEAALIEGIVVSARGVACPASVEVTSLVQSGATVRFACGLHGRSEVEVAMTLLTDLDDRYRTLAVAGTPEGPQRFMFTSADPRRRITVDPAVRVDAGAPPADAATDVAATRQPFGGSLPFESQYVALIDGNMGPGGLALGMLVALGVGAAHGLAPGHGKAIAAAYLVGDRGRPRDAVLLGAVVAAMHTWSVLALGFALYSATQRPATVALSAWLQLMSGVLVAGLGGWLVIRRLRERRTASAGFHAHSAGHAHLPAGVAHPLSWQGLVALGAAGGLLPSPSALLVLFTALAVGRVAYGLGLIAMFSLGLALTISAVGLAVLRGRDLVRVRAGDGRLSAVLRAAPLAGAAAVAVLGLVIATRATVALTA